jgi:hypothetical protein
MKAVELYRSVFLSENVGRQKVKGRRSVRTMGRRLQSPLDAV